MTRESYRVFSAGRISGLAIKNRLIRSATYEGAMTTDGQTTAEILKLYANLAKGGSGAIITGHMAVSQKGLGSEHQIRIYEDAHTSEIARIAEVVHGVGNGCKILAQLNHAGRQVFHDNAMAECVGPSAVPSPILQKQCRELSQVEIGTIITCFVEAISRVKGAGFDGVQLHAAHGYLLSSFLSPHTNRRQDRYGGSLEKRLNILKEIITRARERVAQFPILIKLNGTDHVAGGIDGESFPEVASRVAELGFDAIEVSGGIWDCLIRTEQELGFFPLPIPEARTRIARLEQQSYYLDATQDLAINIPLILVGGHRNIESLEKIMTAGKLDFLSLSRPLISEPDLPVRWRNGLGSEKTDCVSCNACLLEVKTKALKCVLKQNRFKQKLVNNLTPHLWKKLFR